MSLNELGEFGLIRKIKSQFHAPDGYMGIGDDCAIIPQHNGNNTLISTDMLVEGTHFLLEDISARDLGWKSAAVNFSDIAACGGKVIGSFLSLALPGTVTESWMDDFMAGFRDMSQKAGAPLLGGDTTSSPDRLCINVTVMGEIQEGYAKLRSDARPGDLICVTGTLGDSAAGLELILKGLPAQDYLIRKHHLPQPRLREGQRLASCAQVHAMMDISDGVASDLRHILEASGVGARISTESLPLSDELLEVCDRYGWNPVRLALCGGEDYELLFTLDPSCSSIPGIRFSIIGEITQETGIRWSPDGKDYMGFRHF